jgi:prolyl-tRNA editing enzyme YbaK/EbsC (Cys-tRNA(Pro) deacylase)
VTDPSTARVAAFIARHELDAEIISTPDGVPTVEAAAAALGVSVDRILKTLVFSGPAGEVVIAIACGTGRVDRRKLAGAVDLPKVTIASPADVLAATRYPAGGVAPVDLPSDALIVIDEHVVRQDEVFGGSGTDLHMMRIRTADIARLNGARIASILRDPES